MERRKRFWFWHWLLIGAAFALLAWSGAPLVQQHQRGAFTAIVLLATLAELLLIRYPLRPEYRDRGIWLSVSTPIVIAAVITYGWQFGVWLDAAISFAAGLLTVYLKNSRLRWALVNTAQSVLSASAAGWMALLILGGAHNALSLQMLAAVTAALTVYMVVNTLLVSVTVAIAEGARLWWVLGQTILGLPRDVALMTPLSFFITAALIASISRQDRGMPRACPGDRSPWPTRVRATHGSARAQQVRCVCWAISRLRCC